MGKIKKILENELVGGTQSTDVYPVTSVKAVYDENNERLDNILNRRGVVNVSTNYNDDHIAEVLTLEQAIAKVPSSDRVLGFQGNILTADGWVTYKFIGTVITQWSNTQYWVNVVDSSLLVQELGSRENAVMSQAAITMSQGLHSGLIERSVDSVHAKEYYEAIKFIAVVPKEGYEEDEYSIYVLSTFNGKVEKDSPEISMLNLWILEDTVAATEGKLNWAARYMQAANESYLNKIQYIKVDGEYCTLYAIVDWNPVYNYKNINGKYVPVIWGSDVNPSNPATIKVQKIEADDPRIVNWDEAIKASNFVDDFGIDEEKVVNQKTVSSLFGVCNGLEFYFSERATAELKIMRIIKRLYFSFSDTAVKKDLSVGVLGNSGGDKSKFWFGISYLDGTSTEGEYITIPLILMDSLPNGVKSFFVENDFGKMYVEIDFDAYNELGDPLLWDFAKPTCRVTNIIDKDDAIWNRLDTDTYVNDKLDIFSKDFGFIKPVEKSPELIASGKGYINNSTGSITEDIWDYSAYRCSEGDTIDINIQLEDPVNDNIVAVYAIYNSGTVFSADTLVEKGPKWDTGASTYTNTITIPAGGKAIVFCTWEAKSIDVKRTTLETIVTTVEAMRSPKYVLRLTGESEMNKILRDAIIDARLILDDESKHDEFWSGSHSFEYNSQTYISPQRLFGVCQSVGTDIPDYLRFFWMYPNGNHVPYNSAFQVDKGEGTIVGDNVEYFENKVNLDGYSATLHIVINWNIVPAKAGVFSGNYLDNSLISKAHDGIIQNLMLVPEEKYVSPTQFSDMTKLNFGVDGDSITAGNQWSFYVTKYLGFANHHNAGVGSARWACKKQTLGDVTYQTQEYGSEDFAGISDGWESTSDPIEIQKRCNNCAKVHVQKFIDEVTKGQYPAPDIFAFAMGTNDSDTTAADDAIATGTNYPTGDMLFTLAGAMKWCIQKIHETYPNCKIFILLPIQRHESTGGNSANLEKIEIMKDVAKAFSVEVIDMYSNCGISSMLETGTGPYLRDGLHPNVDGQKLMGKYAASRIREYIYQ